MSENPATWKTAENVIDAAWSIWAMEQEHEVCGLSLPFMIATALREAGLLEDDGEPPRGVVPDRPRPPRG